MSADEFLLGRERLVVGAGLVLLTLLAWTYIWAGAGMGMSALDMTAVTLFPHLHEDVLGAMDSEWLVVVGMWFTMMIAMMTPSAAPLALLYGRVLRHHSGTGTASLRQTSFLLAGYLAVWFVYSVAAATVQKLLEPTGLLSGMMLWSRSAVLSALVLASAGLYQMSALKYACLQQCRSPVGFLTENWRAGNYGAFTMGLRHGSYCVGCCWVLMALLFVGGVMNLAWIAALTALVLAEKITRLGPYIGKVSGVVLIVWAIATLLV